MFTSFYRTRCKRRTHSTTHLEIHCQSTTQKVSLPSFIYIHYNLGSAFSKHKILSRSERISRDWEWKAWTSTRVNIRRCINFQHIHKHIKSCTMCCCFPPRLFYHSVRIDLCFKISVGVKNSNFESFYPLVSNALIINSHFDLPLLNLFQFNVTCFADSWYI